LSAAASTKGSSGMNETETPQGGPASGMTFEGLVMLFGTAGLVHLGAAPDPAGGERRVDLDQAKQAIDLLELLRTRRRAT